MIERREILVTGGAGFIGSHLVDRLLCENIWRVTVVDDFNNFYSPATKRENVRAHFQNPSYKLVEADIRDREALKRLFNETSFEAIVHLAARAGVRPSLSEPQLYNETNVTGTLNLLEAMRRHGVSRLVFSSTAAVFGQPQADRIDEDHPQRPINPYGASKLMVERILADAAAAYGLRSVALRYFNAAGAAPDGTIGEAHDPETHLIPNAIKAALGAGPALTLFGDDYPTPDGTCIRDYVHVDDLAQAHQLALAHMDAHAGAHTFNLGNGQGFSVREVIAAVERVSGRPVPHSVAPRRPGDPSILVASSERARAVLGWTPEYTTLDPILATAVRWHAGRAG